ncbi:Clp protease N-terminal domain-containing protein, partial [Synechococcus sp. CCY9202]
MVSSVSTSPAPGSLTSDPDRFSEEAWELLLASQDTARRWRHGAMDVEHLLQALLQDPRWARFVDPLPLDLDLALDRIEAFCAEQPPSRGGELYIGDALEDLLEAADRCRAAWGSQLLDVPHLLLALLEEPRLGAELLAEQGLSEDLLRRQLRPGAPAVERNVAEDPWQVEAGRAPTGAQ